MNLHEQSMMRRFEVDSIATSLKRLRLAIYKRDAKHTLHFLIAVCS